MIHGFLPTLTLSSYCGSESSLTPSRLNWHFGNRKLRQNTGVSELTPITCVTGPASGPGCATLCIHNSNQKIQGGDRELVEQMTPQILDPSRKN